MIKKIRPSPSSTSASIKKCSQTCTKASTKENFKTLAPALLIAFFALTAEAVVFYAPPASGQMAVFFPPNTSETTAFEAVSNAGGSFVGSSRFSNIIIVYAPDEGFRQRISNHGGWFTLAAQGLCSPFATKT
ncbi:MAG: hypothetical protein COC00_007490 [Rhizobiales bacterium]|nr:hypothetical protein [Hyphomicrobiales bacterium]